MKEYKLKLTDAEAKFLMQSVRAKTWTLAYTIMRRVFDRGDFIFIESKGGKKK